MGAMTVRPCSEPWEHDITSSRLGSSTLRRAHCAPLKARGWGRIVNISSVHGLVASPHKCAYVSAKHGLIGLTRTAALEGAAHGITVNALCPGAVRTPLVEAKLGDLARLSNIPVEQVLEQVLLAPAAIKRLMEPSQVAALVGYLISDAGTPSPASRGLSTADGQRVDADITDARHGLIETVRGRGSRG
jgi:3-hydroxybutyrate dehydrogenase